MQRRQCRPEGLRTQGRLVEGRGHYTEFCGSVLDHSEEEIGLVLDVVVDCAFAHARPLEDVVERGPRETLRGELTRRLLQQAHTLLRCQPLKAWVGHATPF